ncbi:MAG: hypothetical protein QM698_16780 [Micropepsaceae bacterium]
MKRLMFALAAAAAFAAPALAEETTADLRQAAIDKCVAAGTGAEADQAATMCTCLVDGMIEKIPGEDGVKMLKLLIADPKSPEEAGAALGVPPADAQAFIEAHMQTVGEVSASCLPQ